MKLRLFKDSIRLRLSKDDVAELLSSGCVRCETAFTAESRLVYLLQSDTSAKHINATLRAGDISVAVPPEIAVQWCNSDEVSLRASQAAGPDRFLNILIEKDFECLDPHGNEPGEHLFPNPRLTRPIDPGNE